MHKIFWKFYVRFLFELVSSSKNFRIFGAYLLSQRIPQTLSLSFEFNLEPCSSGSDLSLTRVRPELADSIEPTSRTRPARALVLSLWAVGSISEGPQPSEAVPSRSNPRRRIKIQRRSFVVFLRAARARVRSTPWQRRGPRLVGSPPRRLNGSLCSALIARRSPPPEVVVLPAPVALGALWTREHPWPPVPLLSSLSAS